MTSTATTIITSKSVKDHYRYKVILIIENNLKYA